MKIGSLIEKKEYSVDEFKSAVFELWQLLSKAQTISAQVEYMVEAGHFIDSKNYSKIQKIISKVTTSVTQGAGNASYVNQFVGAIK